MSLVAGAFAKEAINMLVRLATNAGRWLWSRFIKPPPPPPPFFFFSIGEGGVSREETERFRRDMGDFIRSGRR